MKIVVYYALVGTPKKEGGSWEALAPDLPVTCSVASSYQEILDRIKEAMEFALENYVEEGEEFPDPQPKGSFEDVKERLQQYGQSWEYVPISVDLDAVEEKVKCEAAITLQKLVRGHCARLGLGLVPGNN